MTQVIYGTAFLKSERITTAIKVPIKVGTIPIGKLTQSSRGKIAGLVRSMLGEGLVCTGPSPCLLLSIDLDSVRELKAMGVTSFIEVKTCKMKLCKVTGRPPDEFSGQGWKCTAFSVDFAKDLSDIPEIGEGCYV